MATYFYYFKKAIYIHINNILSEMPWEHILDVEGVDTAVKKFNSILNSVIQKKYSKVSKKHKIS